MTNIIINNASNYNISRAIDKQKYNDSIVQKITLNSITSTSEKKKETKQETRQKRCWHQDPKPLVLSTSNQPKSYTLFSLTGFLLSINPKLSSLIYLAPCLALLWACRPTSLLNFLLRLKLNCQCLTIPYKEKETESTSNLIYLLHDSQETWLPPPDFGVCCFLSLPGVFPACLAGCGVATWPPLFLPSVT